MPADAFRDKKMMEWIFASKSSEETTNDDFSDLMKQKFQERASQKKMSFITAYHVKQTGLAPFARE